MYNRDGRGAWPINAGKSVKFIWRLCVFLDGCKMSASAHVLSPPVALPPCRARRHPMSLYPLAARALDARSHTSLPAPLPASRACFSPSVASTADGPRLCPLGRQGASRRTCQRAARRLQARPKVRACRRTARAPAQRPLHAYRRASARASAHTLLTRQFRLSQRPVRAVLRATRPSRPYSTRSPRGAHSAARFVGGRAADGDRGRGARVYVCVQGPVL